MACVECAFRPVWRRKSVVRYWDWCNWPSTSTRMQATAAERIPTSRCDSGCHETRLCCRDGSVQGDRLRPRQTLTGSPTQAMSCDCTSCHSQIVQGQHMTVTQTTCFLCHFKGRTFQRGTGGSARTAIRFRKPSTILGAGSSSHHNLAYEQGVDCQSCHADLIRGNGELAFSGIHHPAADPHDAQGRYGTQGAQCLQRPRRGFPDRRPDPVRDRRTGHRLHAWADGHALRGGARPEREGRAGDGADEEHRLRGGDVRHPDPVADPGQERDRHRDPQHRPRDGVPG